MKTLDCQARKPGLNGLVPAMLACCVAFAAPCSADVVTDWDARASSLASPAAAGERESAIVNAAMFDAANSIAHAYRPYHVAETTSGPASIEAAIAGAAATALARLHPDRAGELQAALSSYLGTLAAKPEELERGRSLGEAVALKMLEWRAGDGSSAVDPYRPRTQPGQYVPTATMVGSTWPKIAPFALERADQFRPGPPVPLTGPEWAADYNEVKSLGGRDSRARSAAQTETARFWLMTGPQAYHPLARQVAEARHLGPVDSARFMAVFAITLTDAYIAVFDAKYHYEFWRPVTAIRNGDADGNPATEVEATWQPIDSTPMHPEYPCAHCVLSGAAAAVIEALAGTGALPELSLTSSTAPGVTHRFATLAALETEVANARIWAGFHYRFSTVAGTALGRQVGQYVAAHVAAPSPAARKR